LIRTPPTAVLTQLRKEVGFCCAIDDCDSPYLTWHHFDPPWRIEHHHRPEGMIALCREHADKADHGAYTNDQLRDLKQSGRHRLSKVAGKFEWRRHDLLAVVGGNFYLRVPTILQIGARKVIWFERDEDGYQLLNFKMPSLTGRSRAQIRNNFWTVAPDDCEVVCPPNGRVVSVQYDNGDRFKVEFFTLNTVDDFSRRYPRAHFTTDLAFPLTAVEVHETAAGTGLSLEPHSTSVGTNRISSGFMADCQVGIMIDDLPQASIRLRRPTRASLLPSLSDWALNVRP
jgi:hypothetical protein